MAAPKGSAQLKEREQELLMRLEQHVNTMTDNFIFVVKAARINEDDDKPEGDKKVPGEIPEVLAEKIILGGKGLLELVSELKRKVGYCMLHGAYCSMPSRGTRGLLPV